ncbi:RNA methyltransferase, partial [Ancylostoma ceylanicum]
MHLFYDPDITKETITYQLNETESRHVCKVLRMKEGDTIGLLNGNGLFAEAIVAEANPKRCTVEITGRKEQPAPSYSIHIAIAPTKMNDRMEWFIEKATELGNIAVSAMKQSKRLYLPKMNDLVKADAFIREHPNGFIAHCYDGDKQRLPDVFDGSSPILIGPEGDFSPEEAALAKKKRVKEITLGEKPVEDRNSRIICLYAGSDEVYNYLQRMVYQKTTDMRSIIVATVLLICGNVFSQYPYQLAVLKYNGGGDYYANPTSVPNLVKFCNEQLNMNISPDVPYVDVGSPDLFLYPFVHMTGHGNVVFSAQEAENLRTYLMGGGFLHIDDNYGMDQFIR